MFLKSLVLLFVLFTLGIKGAELGYSYSSQARGWIKLQKPATWTDASILCEIEGGIIASPDTSELRDAISDYISQADPSVSTILTGMQLRANYLSMDGVSLLKMPVTVEPGASIDYQSSKNCVAWTHDNATVTSVNCKETLPYVCYKKKIVEVSGCGTLDPEYVYDKGSGSCYKFHRQAQAWSKAYTTCKAEGAYLAIINSQLESIVLKDLFAKNPTDTLNGSSATANSFVGIRDWLNGESWRTVKGQSLEDLLFTTWASGEPNNGHGGIEHCVSITRAGTYNDISCDLPLSFICEKEPKFQEITYFDMILRDPIFDDDFLQE